MIRLTERYYDTNCHSYQTKPLFLNELYIVSIKHSDDRYEDYCVVTDSVGAVYTVLRQRRNEHEFCGLYYCRYVLFR